MTDTFYETWGASRRMNALEAAMWRGERHPANSSTGVFIEVLDGSPDFGQIEAAHRQALDRLPRFRRRVSEPLIPIGPPEWVDDERFDLAYHLRRVRLPGPGTHAQLLEFAQAQAATPLDRGRPLWVGTFVEGLAGRKAAYVLVLHHCLMDGMGAMQLLSRLQSGSEQPNGSTPAEPTSALGELVHTAQKAITAGPLGTARFAGSLARVMSPPRATPSPLMATATRNAWRFATLDVELRALRAAGTQAGGTINDAYVAAVLGGLRRFPAGAGVELGDIPMSMPVSVRPPGDEQGGNRFAGAFLAAPSATADPAERIRAVGQTVRAIQAEPALDFFRFVLPIVTRAPSPLVAAAFTTMQARADLTVSNVPGPRTPLRIGGREVERLLCFGALPGSAMTTVLCSYAGRATIGINCDGAVFPDIGALLACMEAGLDEVLALG